MKIKRQLKEGLHTDFSNRDKIKDLLLFETMNNPGGKLVSLKEYRDSMPALQQELYYITGDSRNTLEKSPHLEIMRKQNYDVLFMTDPIDEFVLPSIGEIDGKKLKCVNKGDVKFDESIQKELEDAIAMRLIEGYESPISHLKAYAENDKIELLAM